MGQLGITKLTGSLYFKENHGVALTCAQKYLYLKIPSRYGFTEMLSVTVNYEVNGSLFLIQN